MNPQEKVSFDPKLKEAYDSVMGIENSQTSSPTPIVPTIQEPINVPAASSSSEPQIISQPPISSPQPPIEPDPKPKSIVVAYHTSPQNKDQSNKKWNWGLIIVALIAVFILLAYAIFWIKVFDFKLPFLSFMP